LEFYSDVYSRLSEESWEGETHCGMAGKYSRKDGICGMNSYGKLADSDRRVN